MNPAGQRAAFHIPPTTLLGDMFDKATNELQHEAKELLKAKVSQDDLTEAQYAAQVNDIADYVGPRIRPVPIWVGQIEHAILFPDVGASNKDPNRDALNYMDYWLVKAAQDHYNLGDRNVQQALAHLCIQERNKGWMDKDAGETMMGRYAAQRHAMGGGI